MPATSKKQQKFMGIVHAIQKGEQPASKFSKAAQKAAKSMKKKSAKDYASTKHKGLPSKVKKEERDYKAEYKKFQSSTKAKKYRAELNQYNRKRGTYGNGDGKDASHKGGKIVGFEKESTNRGRAEKSRLKKEAIFEDMNDTELARRIKHWSTQHKGTGIGYGHVLANLAVHMKEMGWDKSFKEVVRVAKELGKKKRVESVDEHTVTFTKDEMEQLHKNGEIVKADPDGKEHTYAYKESVNEGLYNSQGEQTDFKKGDMVKDINPDCPHVGSEGEVTKVGEGTITFKVTNNGKAYKEGDELEKTVEQMVKLKESVNEAKMNLSLLKIQTKNLATDVQDLFKAVKDGDEGEITDELNQVKFRIDMLRKKGMGLKEVKKESVNEGFTKYHIRLTNTRGWYGVWDKNGKQKFEGDRRYVMRQLKKLKTRMGNVQLKSLIDVATKRKGKNIEFDVVESVNEVRSKTITAIGSIIGKKQAKKIGGVLVDIQTANVIMKVWNALNKSNRSKFEKLPIKKMATVAWKLMK